METLNCEAIKAEAILRLKNYLAEHGYRRTPERFAILDEIYSHDGHFDIETLRQNIEAKKYRVSRATLYNSIELFMACKLVVRHQFTPHLVRYERCLGILPHDHMICEKCGAIIEFSTPEMDVIYKHLDEKYGFHSHSHQLYLYGECEACKQKR